MALKMEIKKQELLILKVKMFLFGTYPPVVTCPGALDCLNYCYNADTRTEVFPIESWCINWYWALNKTEMCEKKICEVIEDYNAPVVRVHSSGDFFSNEYINMWNRIAKKNTHALFWAYTRSWKIKELLDGIMALAILPNFQVIASIEEGQIPPPKLRYCVVGEQYERFDMFNCPEQYEQGVSCVNCRKCYTNNKANIYFIKH